MRGNYTLPPHAQASEKNKPARKEMCGWESCAARACMRHSSSSSSSSVESEASESSSESSSLDWSRCSKNSAAASRHSYKCSGPVWQAGGRRCQHTVAARLSGVVNVRLNQHCNGAKAATSDAANGARTWSSASSSCFASRHSRATCSARISWFQSSKRTLLKMGMYMRPPGAAAPEKRPFPEAYSSSVSSSSN